MNRRLPPLALLALLVILPFLCASCGVAPETISYAITTDNGNVCCKTLRYQTTDFPEFQTSTLQGDGVVVRFMADTVQAVCGTELRLPLVIANNSDSDQYIPISHELHDGTIRLFPWIVMNEADPVRIARQIQYGDLLERTDSRLLFHRLPAGKQVQLTGIVPKEWLCRTPKWTDPSLLIEMLHPKYYADYSRALRTPKFWPQESLHSVVGIRYDVVHTTLAWLGAAPQRSTHTTSAGDSVSIGLAVMDEPGMMLNSSQQVAQSNVITMKLKQ